MTTKFKQTRKIGVAGNFINQLMGNNDSTPELGGGATELHFSDRTPYQVIEVSKDLRKVRLQRYEAVADLSKNNEMGHQNWVLAPTNVYKTLVWRNNAWKQVSETITFTKKFRQAAEEAGFFTTALYLRKTNPQLADDIYQNSAFPQKVVEGITKVQKSYTPISIIFGVMEYYYDWSI